MRYHYTISHTAGKDLCTADMLSRAPTDILDTQAEQLQQDTTSYVNLIIDHLPATETKIQEIQREQGPTYQVLLPSG